MSEYSYHVSQNEIDYRILLSREEGESVLDAKNRVTGILSKTDGYCPCKIDHNSDTKCMCLEFRNFAGEGACQCGLYTKVLRSDRDKQSYAEGPKFTEKKLGRKPKQKKTEGKI